MTGEQGRMISGGIRKTLALALLMGLGLVIPFGASAAEGKALFAALDKAIPGGQLRLAGDYTGKPGTVYVLKRSITITGPARLVNIKIIVEAPSVTFDRIDFVEQDCYADELKPTECTPAEALLTLGYIGHPISSATVTNSRFFFTRAYTGIETGYDHVENLTIEHCSFSDGDMSAISIYQGKHIHIADVQITGSELGWRDDGIALMPINGPISDVLIEGSTATWAADLVGIGASMQYDMSDITIRDSQCRSGWYCVFDKSSLMPPPASWKNSTATSAGIHRLTIDNVILDRQ